MTTLSSLKQELSKLANPRQAINLQRFFKTGKGEYGAGDIFLGLTVPQSRKMAIKYKHLTLKEVEQLLSSKIHEYRLIALLLLVHNYKNDEEKRKEIYNFYLKNTTRINNWDLVDLSSHKIVGDFLLDKDKSILYKLAKSKDLWERRIAIISTARFIQQGRFTDTLEISKLLLHDKHDLIHKAVGWMLREVGKKDKQVLEGFLKHHYKSMPRTMLRYSIEKFPERERKKYLKGEI